MKILKVFLLTVLSFLLILYSLVFMLNLGLERTLFNLDHYKDMSQRFNVFSQLNQNLETGLLGPNENQELDEQGREMIVILQDVFDEHWLEEQFLIVTEDILSYTKGDSHSLTATINLTDRKDILEQKIVQRLTQEQGLSQVQAARMSKQISSEINLPDQINLGELMNEEVENVFSIIIMVRKYYPMVSAAVFVLIFLLMVLITGFSRGLKWYGAGMLISAILLLIGQVALNSSLNMYFVGSFIDIPSGLEFSLDLIKYTLRKMYLIPIVYSLIGLLFISTGTILSRRNRKKSI